MLNGSKMLSSSGFKIERGPRKAEMDGCRLDESFFGPIMAAVFDARSQGNEIIWKASRQHGIEVADRRNHRVVKLLLGYRNDPSMAMHRDEQPLGL